jgi:hypothetical protein
LQQKEHDAADTKALNVLIVDDSAAIHRDGLEALAALEKHKFSLVTLRHQHA